MNKLFETGIITGNGIVKKKRIFEKYATGLRSQSVNVESTGLGLYIVRRILAQFNAEVSLESLSDPTIFTITFRLSDTGV